jgi:hypothetical protein
MGAVNDILTKWTLDREQVLRDNYAKKNIKASGKFGETLEHTITDNSTEIRGRKYIGGVIYGRRPNTDQSPEGLRRWAGGFASTMQKWAKNKGIGDGSWSLGFAIAYNIARNGWKIPNKNNPSNDGRMLSDTFTPESIDNLKNQLGKLYLTETSQITKQIFEAWRQ